MSLAHVDGFRFQTYRDTKFYVGDYGQTEDITERWITLTKDGWLVIRAGYAWDGASGKITINTMNSRQASLLHDALYQLMRRELIDRKYKANADRRFHEQLLTDGMSDFRAGYWLKAVTKGGNSSTLPSHKRVVLYAP